MNIAIFAPFQTASFRDVAEKCARALMRNHNVALHDFNDIFIPLGKWRAIIYFNTLFLPSLIHLPRYHDLAERVIFSCDGEGAPLRITPYFKSWLDKTIITTPTRFCQYEYERIGLKVQEIIPRAIDVSEFIVSKVDVEAYRRQFQDKKILFFCGALHTGMAHQRKGIEELLEAFKIVKERERNVVLVHYTNHYPEEVGVKIPNEIKDAFIVERLFGRLSKKDLAIRYHACDVYVHPAHSEGFGLPLIEAMVCYKPPVYIRWGAMAEVVQGYGYGVIPTHVQTFTFMNLLEQKFAMYEPEELAEVIIYALNDTKNEDLKIATHNFAVESYNYLKVYERFEVLL